MRASGERQTVRVLSGGFQTTVQDLGRFGHGHLGVSASGAADPLSLRIGNRLVGNDEGAPALEMTLVGGRFAFEQDAVFSLAGSDCGAWLDGFEVPLWAATSARAGATLRCGALRDGARCTLCVRGGIGVPSVLGSASTHLATGVGGLEGRALRTGDVLPIGAPPARPARATGLNADTIDLLRRRPRLRVTAGAQEGWFDRDAREVLVEAEYRVSESSDRMGLRLSGRPLACARAGALLTEGVPLGAIQIPPSGQPLVLFVEHQTTGGYPKIASVVAADLHAIGQLRPRDRVCFEWVTLGEARALLEAQERSLRALLD